MAKYRQLHTDFWNDGFVLDLTPEEKYFYIYLMSNTNTSQCGIYELPKRIIETQTGYNRETVDKLLKRFTEYNKISYCEETKELLILNWIKYNQPNNSNAIKCVNKELKGIKNKKFVCVFYNQCVKQCLDIESIFIGIDIRGWEGAYKDLGSKEVISNEEEVISNEEEVISNEEDEKKTEVTFEDVVLFFQKNINKPKNMEYKKIMSWSKCVSCEVIVLAIQEAVQYDVKNIQYIESILESWKKKNLKTAEEVINYKKIWVKNSNKYTKKSSNWDLKERRNYDFQDLKRKLLGWDHSQDN